MSHITLCGGVAKFGIALGSGPRGLGFESPHSDQMTETVEFSKDSQQFLSFYCTLGFLPKNYEPGVQKMAKIKMKTSGTIKEHFDTFILSKQAEGAVAKTLTTYRQHLSAVSKYLNIDMAIDALTKTDLDKMIACMCETTLSPNSISSYTITIGNPVSRYFSDLSEIFFHEFWILLTVTFRFFYV